MAPQWQGWWPWCPDQHPAHWRRAAGAIAVQHCRRNRERRRATLDQLVTVQGLITVRPAAVNALVSRDATAKPCAAAIAAI